MIHHAERYRTQKGWHKLSVTKQYNVLDSFLLYNNNNNQLRICFSTTPRDATQDLKIRSLVFRTGPERWEIGNVLALTMTSAVLRLRLLGYSWSQSVTMRQMTHRHAILVDSLPNSQSNPKLVLCAVQYVTFLLFIKNCVAASNLSFSPLSFPRMQNWAQKMLLHANWLIILAWLQR